MTKLIAFPIVALAACAPETTPVLDLDGPFAVAAPDCVTPSTPLGVGVLDLAAGPTNYVALFMPTAASAAVVQRADLHFTLERGDFDDATLRASSTTIVTGCSDCGKPLLESAVVLVDETTSAKLASDAAVTALIRENGRIRLDVDAVLHGLQPGALVYGSDVKPVAATTTISASIDLCSGCLAGPSTCADGAAPVPNPAQCIAGVDVPNKVCP